MKTQIITASAVLNQYFSTKIRRHNCYFEQKIRSSSSYSSSSPIIIIRCGSQSSRGGLSNNKENVNENKKKKKATTEPKPSPSPLPSPSGPQLFFNPFQPADANANTNTNTNNMVSSKGDDVVVEVEVEEKIPQVVFERMALRILAYVGIPMAIGFLSLQVIGMVSEKQIWEVPKWVSFAAILLTFGSSSLGVAFGALSTSWDPNKEGSLLGFNEFRENWDEMWESNKKI